MFLLCKYFRVCLIHNCQIKTYGCCLSVCISPHCMKESHRDIEFQNNDSNTGHPYKVDVASTDCKTPRERCVRKITACTLQNQGRSKGDNLCIARQGSQLWRMQEEHGDGCVFLEAVSHLQKWQVPHQSPGSYALAECHPGLVAAPDKIRLSMIDCKCLRSEK